MLPCRNVRLRTFQCGEFFSACVCVTFSSHRQSSAGSVVVTATCATSPLPPIMSKTITGAQNHRTRRLLKLAFHRGAALVGGLRVVPWSMFRLWEKSVNLAKDC